MGPGFVTALGNLVYGSNSQRDGSDSAGNKRGFSSAPDDEQRPKMAEDKVSGTVAKTDAEWKAQLTGEEYNILRKKGTERAMSSEY